MKKIIELFGNLKFPNNFRLKTHFCRLKAEKMQGLGDNQPGCRTSPILCFLFFAAAFLLWACASLFPPKDETAEIAPPEEKTAQAEFSYMDALNSAGFRSLPPEAREYLIALAEAFGKKNKSYLFSQGEAHYEKELRSKYDDETYFAMLYRTGPYSEETGWMPASLPRLDYSSVKAIEYTNFQERGQVLEIKGRLRLENAETIPFEIILLWRLTDPKILGAYP